MTNWIDIAALADIPAQGARLIRTRTGCVALFRTHDDRVFALDDRCPNCGGELMDRPARSAALLAKYPASAERRHKG